MRAFLAIPVPEPLREQLAAVAREIPKIRAQAPENIHLTVRFLGEIRRDSVDGLLDALRPVLAKHPAFQLGLRGVSGFPRPGQARFAWVGITDDELRAGALVASVSRVLEGLGIPPEGRPWRGHVTLGRFQTPTAVPRKLRDADHDFGEIPVDRVVLYSSELLPDGPRYTSLAELSLGTGM